MTTTELIELDAKAQDAVSRGDDNEAARLYDIIESADEMTLTPQGERAVKEIEIANRAGISLEHLRRITHCWTA